MAGGGGGGGSSGAASGFFARLKTNLGGVSSSLTLLPYAGNTVLINGKTVVIPGTGLTRLVTDNLITALGADAGAPGSASTLYYVYISNALSPFSPASIRLSATPPTVVGGVRYLCAAGNALNWRFVGWVYLNATPQFEMSATNALIANYYNRQYYHIFANPNYVDGAGLSIYSVPGSYAPANGGVGSQVKLIANGEDAQSITVTAMMADTGGTSVAAGPGIDGNDPTRVGFLSPSTLTYATAFADDSQVLSEGFHTVDLYAGGDPGNYMVSGTTRFGAASDPRGAMVQVGLWV
jgi:hypothetical protein